MRLSTVITLSVLSQLGCAANPSSQPAPRPQVGLLVMAHGGSTGWNEDVARAVAPLKTRVPTALAFGMADSTTLAAGLDSLRARGAKRIVLVRVFVSGDSFLERTARLLQIDIGLGDSPQPGAFIDHGLAVATHLDGLADWAGITEIVVDRASRVSAQPNRHSVLLFAHGQGDDDHNTRLLQRMEQTATAFRDRGFRHVRAITLREDWPSLRHAAEEEARTFVATRAAEGDTVIVVPFRLSGFGPYADVLRGLSYVATPGFLPHPSITDWIISTAETIACNQGWMDNAFRCTPPVVFSNGQLPR